MRPSRALKKPEPPQQVPAPLRGVAGLVVANSSLVIATLFYMGWAYEDAYLGYFHLNPLSLDARVSDYLLHSLALFSPSLVIAAVLIVIAITVDAWEPRIRIIGRVIQPRSAATTSQRAGRRPWTVDRLLIGSGAALAIAGVVATWTAGAFPASSYVILALLAIGSLLMTWPRRAVRSGRLAYSLAVVLTAVCALWAGSLYAHGVGIRNARNTVSNLPTRTAVAVYSTDPLALTGPGVTVQTLPPGYSYRYLYEGLRLLLSSSNRFYLVPVGWTPSNDITYVLNDGSGIRVELY